MPAKSIYWKKIPKGLEPKNFFSDTLVLHIPEKRAYQKFRNCMQGSIKNSENVYGRGTTYNFICALFWKSRIFYAAKVEVNCIL